MDIEKVASLQKKAEKFMVKDEDEVIKPIIYHYCSIDSFMGILKTGKIWASHYGSLNDYSESRLFFDTLVKVAQEKSNKNNIERINMFLKNFELNLRDYYIASFSTNPDSLSQWYMYANQGKGVCIGFLTSSFDIPRRIPILSIDSARSKGIFNVSYDNNSYRTLANDLIDLVNEDVFGVIPPSVEKLSLAMKHCSFKQEEEVRIVEIQDARMMINPDMHSFRTKNPGKYFNFRTKNGNQIVSYREIPFSTERKRIHSLWLGPKCQIDDSNLTLFFDHVNCEIEDKIYLSSCPFKD